MNDEVVKWLFGITVVLVVFAIVLLWWASHGFDRAKSNRVDSTVGDDRKSSKTYTCKRWGICSSRL